jgi:hypothetical protein
MRLRSDVVFLPLEDEVVVFSEEAQCLVGLNASAAHVIRQIEAGTPSSALLQQLAAAGVTSLEEAAQWVDATIDALGAHGMLADGPLPQPSGAIEESLAQQEQARRIAAMPPYTPFTAVAERRYRLLDSVALMRFALPGQAEAVDAALGHLMTGETVEPTILIEVHGTILGSRGSVRSHIYCDGSPIQFTTGLHRLAPAVKSLFWKLAIGAYDFFFYFHAGVVGTGDKCILLPAASGSGKSSLTAALVSRGFRYLSDEVALVEPVTFRVPPVPLALCVKSTGWDLMSRYFPNIRALMGHQRMDGKVVRYVPPSPSTLQATSASVSHIIFPRYVESAATQIRPIPRSAALRRLMGDCWACGRLDHENVSEMIRWIAGIDCYDLTFSSLEEAADLVTEVAPPKLP